MNGGKYVVVTSHPPVLADEVDGPTQPHYSSQNIDDSVLEFDGKSHECVHCMQCRNVKRLVEVKKVPFNDVSRVNQIQAGCWMPGI